MKTAVIILERNCIAMFLRFSDVILTILVRNSRLLLTNVECKTLFSKISSLFSHVIASDYKCRTDVMHLRFQTFHKLAKKRSF